MEDVEEIMEEIGWEGSGDRGEDVSFYKLLEVVKRHRGVEEARKLLGDLLEYDLLSRKQSELSEKIALKALDTYGKNLNKYLEALEDRTPFQKLINFLSLKFTRSALINKARAYARRDVRQTIRELEALESPPGASRDKLLAVYEDILAKLDSITDDSEIEPDNKRGVRQLTEE